MPRSDDDLDRTLYAALVKHPASEIRKEAVLIRAQLQDAVTSLASRAADMPAGSDLWLIGTYYQSELAAVANFIKWGDELQGSAQTNDRAERRRLYARGFLRARRAIAGMTSDLQDFVS